MTAKHSPATSLPWATDDQTVIYQRGKSVNHSAVAEYGRQQDADYIVHSANAYPLAIRAAQRALAALRALGHENVQGARDAEAILRELGEAE